MKRVLVVDDEPAIRQLVGDALREAGYRVDLAANGAAALRLMRRRLPHAIVLDLMMPQLDGSGFVELMRLNPRFAAVPLVLASAADDASQAAERLGARAWLTKPFEIDVLLQTIAELVGTPLPAGFQPLPEAGEPFVAEE
jgi:CheY-like chemotaxis protein